MNFKDVVEEVKGKSLLFSMLTSNGIHMNTVVENIVVEEREDYVSIENPEDPLCQHLLIPIKKILNITRSRDEYSDVITLELKSGIEIVITFK
ncbi:hypothetical protein [Paenibacillus pini]|uniref:Uncharacterized protein n=1 Tax=Paenibacillus pini JCM 16418 TaxID=1236976 RepID=W7Z1K0_9BACL|nr:hypothetical protein [Paenibacillus pini]GAF10856.1 hypothetical protein JCM16418_5083 [Paenibacillus pini JCM 16418]